MKTEQTGKNLREGNRSRLLLRLAALLAINLLAPCYGVDRGTIQPGVTKTNIQLSASSIGPIGPLLGRCSLTLLGAIDNVVPVPWFGVAIGWQPTALRDAGPNVSRASTRV
jgi:hypothetical protein